MMITRERYESGATIQQFIAGAESNQELWRSVYARASVPAELAERAQQLPARHLLVLAEDWCGDAVNTVPVLAKLAEAVPELDLRILGRDANPDLMDPHLSAGAQAIPVVMVLDEDFRELGWWGSRPDPLQAWVRTDGQALDKGARYREIRRWYARDRGRTTLEEVIGLMEQTALQAA
jgi:hypothetical protein